jgi:uncharacterized protein YjlB
MFLDTISNVDLPDEDPVHGVDGPLVEIWHPKAE